MHARTYAMVFALFALLLARAPFAQSQLITQYSVFENWLPIVMIAILVSITFVSIYYLLGVVLNNARVKSRAISELGQALGTGVMLIVIIAILAFFGGGIFSQVPAISPPNLLKVCTSLGSSSIAFLQPGPPFGASGTGTFGGSPPVPSPTAVVCGEVNALQTNPSITDSIDYGIFSSYLIIANLTNQALANINALYVFEGWIGFASKFVAETQFCSPGLPPPPLCPDAAGFGVKFTYSPLAGFDTLKNGITQPTEIQASLTFYMFFLQLVVSILILYLWPWLLAGGIILRATVFTRRAGGLLIALVMAWLLIFPLIYALEYSSFQGLGTSLQPIGASNLPTLPLYTKGTDGSLGVYGASGGGDVPALSVPTISCASGQFVYEGVCGYPKTASCSSQAAAPCPTNPDGTTEVQGININFFVFPKVADVLRFYNCMPPNLPGAELAFSDFYLIPGFGAVTGYIGAVGGLVSGLPYNPTDISYLSDQLGCNANNGISSALALANVYGLMGVTAYLVPLLNLIIIISAAVGISGLLGGDTDIIGLSKLL